MGPPASLRKIREKSRHIANKITSSLSLLFDLDIKPTDIADKIYSLFIKLIPSFLFSPEPMKSKMYIKYGIKRQERLIYALIIEINFFGIRETILIASSLKLRDDIKRLVMGIVRHVRGEGKNITTLLPNIEHFLSLFNSALELSDKSRNANISTISKAMYLVKKLTSRNSIFWLGKIDFT